MCLFLTWLFRPTNQVPTWNFCCENSLLLSSPSLGPQPAALCRRRRTPHAPLPRRPPLLHLLLHLALPALRLLPLLHLLFQFHRCPRGRGCRRCHHDRCARHPAQLKSPHSQPRPAYPFSRYVHALTYPEKPPPATSHLVGDNHLPRHSFSPPKAKLTGLMVVEAAVEKSVAGAAAAIRGGVAPESGGLRRSRFRRICSAVAAPRAARRATRTPQSSWARNW
ncbi:hypothetical protein BRADI_2g40492v3 [Brachypodium distachyon]|nr:hypothetical protein BRADI_2g40492v3 [Brachypodium distachyon]